MKRHILIICTGIIFCVNLSFAQESGKWRGGMEIGHSYPHKGVFGFLAAAELKYNVRNDMNVGIKAEAAYSHRGRNYGAGLKLLSVTYDYYFHYTNRRFAPFVGAGLGYYFCKAEDRYYNGYDGEARRTNSPTGFIRTGFEIGKFRTSLSYNIIRKLSEKSPKGRNNDYIALSIGFYIGGGKWKNTNNKNH